MLKSASLTQILYWPHVEYSTSPDMSIFGKYASRAFKRTFSEGHILKTRWDSFDWSFKPSFNFLVQRYIFCFWHKQFWAPKWHFWSIFWEQILKIDLKKFFGKSHQWSETSFPINLHILFTFPSFFWPPDPYFAKSPLRTPWPKSDWSAFHG